MDLVLDANILFSALLSKSLTRNLLFNQQLKLYAPEYLISELNEHLTNDAELKQKLKLAEDEIEILVRKLLENIEVIPLEEYRKLIKKSLEISPDEFDSPYFAVSLLKKIPLWSNDKRLKKQKEVKVINTQELIKFLSL